MDSATNEIWLSICIPTYNRPLQMERMLMKLMPQISLGIEIIIRDDSENQKTKLLAENLLSSQGINYRYYAGPRIGVDSAAIFLIEKALGRYIWWFSDDDEISSGAIDEIKEIVLLSDYGAIWLNFTYDKIGSLAVDRASGPFATPDDALMTLGTNIGLISTQLVRREVGLKAIDFAKKHVHGFSFSSTAIFLKSIGYGGCYFHRGPAILCNPTTVDEIKEITSQNGSVENDAFKVYGEYFKKLIEDLPAPYSDNAKRRVIDHSFAALWRGMLVGWVGGWEDPQGKRLKMLKLYWRYHECWIALPILCLPLPLVTLLYRIYKIFFSHRKFIFAEKIKDLRPK